MAAAVFNDAKRAFLAGEIDLDAHTIQAALVTGYTPDIDTDRYWTDISGNEESGAGYSAGGETVGSKVITLESGTDAGLFDAADITWSGLDVGTPSHVILYNDSHANKVLIAYFEISTPSNGGDYTIQWNANGILAIS